MAEDRKLMESSKVSTGEKKEETFGEAASRVWGYVKRDLKNEAQWAAKTPEEKIKELQKEAEDKKQAQEKAEAKKKEAEEKKAEDEKKEKERLDKVKKSYIVHTAIIKCSMGLRLSFLIIPKGHGEFIHGMPQLNVADSVPMVNIRPFGGCHSPQNPNVQAVAKEMLKKADENHQSFVDKVENFFYGKPEEDTVNKDLASICAAECTPLINTEWFNGQKDVLIEGKPALLGRCTLQCMHGGEITLFTSGQPEE